MPGLEAGSTIPPAGEELPTKLVPTAVEPVKEPSSALDLPAAPRTVEDIAANDRLKRELSQVIARCPYTFCHSNEILFTGKRMNVGDFVCTSCSLPFRVSNKGDIYLFDAGTDKWERTTIGLNPAYFTKEFIEKNKGKK